MSERVVVTGMGVVSPYGMGLEDFERSLWEGRSAISHLAGDAGEDAFYHSLAGARLKPDLVRGRLAERIAEQGGNAERILARASLSMQGAALSTFEAWDKAGLNGCKPDAHRVGIVVAGNNIDQQYLSDTYERYRQKPAYVSASHMLQYQDTHYVSVLSELFGLNGESFSVGAASASGNVAIIQGYRLIRHGYLDACVVLGPLTRLSRFELQSLINGGTYGGVEVAGAPAEVSRPFDEKHRGFVLGVASGTLILESEKHARARGAEVHARVLGAAVRLDGNRSSNPSLQGEVAVMNEALADAAIPARDIHYLNAHATSTPLGDRTEAEAVETVFRGNPDLWVNSSKGMLGHCLYAAGVVETIASILQMNGGYIHKNLNLERPISAHLRLSRETHTGETIDTFMKNAFGFGGFNSSTIFGKGV